MVPEIEIKVSESGTVTEIGNIDFQFQDNEYCYLFIYLFVYLFIYLSTLFTVERSFSYCIRKIKNAS